MSLSKFEKGYMYRHENCLDTDMLVVNEPVINNEGVTFMVRYWNRSSGIFMPDNLTLDTVNVKKEDFVNWSRI